MSKRHGRVDPMDRLVRLVFRLKRRHYDSLGKIARESGHLSIASWLVALIAPHLHDRK